MAINKSKNLDIENDPEGLDSRDSSERGGLLEEVPISETTKKRHSAIQRRLQEFDTDDDTKHKWKVLVVPGLCLFFGFIFGISIGVLLAGRDFAAAAASENTASNASNMNLNEDPPICKLPGHQGPRFPPNLRIRFEPDATFANATANDNATDSAWAALNPLGKGFVNLDESGDVIFRNGSNTIPAAQTKVISVFHQLHCLNHLRKSLAASAANPIEYSYLIPQLSHHWDHCIDYLRQSLMCASDITLENLQGQKSSDNFVLAPINPRTSTGGSSTPLAGVDGWGTVHLCRDFNVVRTWAEHHRASDDEGID